MGYKEGKNTFKSSGGSYCHKWLLESEIENTEENEEKGLILLKSEES